MRHGIVHVQEVRQSSDQDEGRMTPLAGCSVQMRDYDAKCGPLGVGRRLWDGRGLTVRNGMMTVTRWSRDMRVNYR